MKKKMLTSEEISILTLALSHLLHSGIGMADALTLLGEDEQDQDYRKMLKEMAAGVDAGKSLAAVFLESGRFPSYVCTLLEVGQCTGKPEQTLEALSQYYRDRGKLSRQMRSALLYPTVLLAVLLAVVTVLLVWVLPVFDQVYAQLGSGLTGVAGGLLALGQAMKMLLPWLAALLAILCGAFAVPVVRSAAVKCGKKLLADRGVFRRIYTARFVQALWMCVSSGMTIPEATALAASLGESPAFEKRCIRCREAAEKGASLSQALAAAELLNPAQRRLLEAGERSGRSEQVLASISRSLLEAGEEGLIKMAGKIEPAMVLVSSTVIGMVLLAVLLPLLRIMSAIG